MLESCSSTEFIKADPNSEPSASQNSISR